MDADHPRDAEILEALAWSSSPTHASIAMVLEADPTFVARRLEVLVDRGLVVAGDGESAPVYELTMPGEAALRSERRRSAMDRRERVAGSTGSE